MFWYLWKNLDQTPSKQDGIVYEYFTHNGVPMPFISYEDWPSEERISPNWKIITTEEARELTKKIGLEHFSPRFLEKTLGIVPD